MSLLISSIAGPMHVMKEPDCKALETDCRWAASNDQNGMHQYHFLKLMLCSSKLECSV